MVFFGEIDPAIHAFFCNDIPVPFPLIIRMSIVVTGAYGSWAASCAECSASGQGLDINSLDLTDARAVLEKSAACALGNRQLPRLHPSGQG